MNSGILSKVLIFVLFFLILHLYFFPEVTSYFSQDDFFHLSTVMDKRIADIPPFFYKLSEEYAFYRPVSRELYNFLALNIFDLNPLPYHFINLILILVNGLLGIKFLSLLRNKLNNWIFKTIFLTLYLFSAVHSVELYYLSSVQTLLAAFFVLLSLIFFLKNRPISLIFFSLAVMSHESSLVLLPVLFMLLFIFLKGDLIRRVIITFKILIPFLMVFAIRILIQFSGFGLDSSTTYAPSFSLQTIFNTALWYVLWGFGMPEMLVDFATLRLQFNPNLFKYYGYFTSVAFPAFIVMVFCLGLILIKAKRLIINKAFVFLFFAFFVSLSPLIFFPTHKFIYYLSFPIVIFTGILSYACFELIKTRSRMNILVALFIGTYLLISYQTLQVNKTTYWAAKRAKSAAFILKDIKNRYPNLEKGSTIYVTDDPSYPFISKEWGTSSKQAFSILSGSDAFKLLYRNSTIRTYYESISKPPKGLDKLIVYEARFPY